MFSLPLRDGAELRPMELCHAEAFAANMTRSREHIAPWVSPTFIVDDVEQAKRAVQRSGERRAADSGGLYGIWLDDVLVGGVLFVSFDAAWGIAEVGCWVEPAAEGKGLVTAACRVLVDWAITKRGIARVEWRCRADNARSAAVAQRLGMTLEGTHRQCWPYDGKRYDGQTWAILADEWRSR